MKIKKRWYGISILLAAAVMVLPQYLLAAAHTDAEIVYGRCSQRLQACDGNGHTNQESSFGNFMADAMCWYSGADVALLPSGDIGNHLQKGDVTNRSLENCLMRNKSLAVSELTAAQLHTALEHSISHYVLREDQTVDWSVSEFDGFLQISGLRVIYNVTAPAGERILSLTTEEGITLNQEDQDTIFTVVSTEEVFAGGYGYGELRNYTVLGTEQEAAAAYICQLDEVSIPEDSGRITIGGTRNFITSNGRMVGGMVAVLGLLLVGTSLKFKNKRKL